MSDSERRIKTAMQIEDWLEGRTVSADIQIIRLLLLIAEQNEELLEYGEPVE